MVKKSAYGQGKRVALLVAMLCFFFLGKAQFYVNGNLVGASGQSVEVCVNINVAFSSLGFGTFSWTFEGLTPNQAVGSRVTKVFPAVGLYNVVQSVTTPDTSYSISAVINVTNIAPKPGFNVLSPASGCSSEKFTFQNTTAGSGNKYKWLFGDCATDSISTGVSPVTTFGKAVGNGSSSCETKLYATNAAGCTDSITKSISVKQSPDVQVHNEFGASELYEKVSTFKRCGATLPAEFTFFDMSLTKATNVSYTISWPERGQTSSGQIWPDTGIARIFSNPSNTITVALKGANGCSSSKPYSVYISDSYQPVAKFLNTYNGELICAPDGNNFRIDGASNPLGTVYMIASNDGAFNPSFKHPPADPAIRLVKKGSCGTTSKIGGIDYPNAFMVVLTATNPCGMGTDTMAPMYVSEKAKAGINMVETSCVNSSVLIANTGSFGSIVSVNNGVSSCTKPGKFFWEISPKTYRVDSGTEGSPNGDYANTNGWLQGSDSLHVAFLTNGVYTVKQYIGNGVCGIDTLSKTICVRNPLQASFSLDKKLGCATGTTVKVTNTTMNDSSVCFQEFYRWFVTPVGATACNPNSSFQFVNNTNDTSKNIDLYFQGRGMYQVRMLARLSPLSLDCITEYIDTVTILDIPTARISGPLEVCERSLFAPTVIGDTCSVILHDQYTWKFENGTPATVSAVGNETVAAAFNQFGRFAMTVQASNLCGVVRDTASVLVNAAPTIDKVADTVICSNNALAFTLSSNTGASTTYSWQSSVISSDGKVSGNTSANNQSVPAITDLLSNAGSQPAVIEYRIVANPPPPFKCASDTVMVRVTLLPQIKALKDTTICLGKTAQLNAIGTNVVKWQWQPALGLSNASIANPVTTNALLQSTTYLVTATSAQGCTNTDSVSVEVLQPFTLAVSPKESFLCLSGSVQLEAAGGEKYTWSPAAGLNNPLIANPIAQADQTITYYVSASDSNDCFVQKDSVTIKVGSSPTVDLGTGSTVMAGTQVSIFAATTGDIKSYTWSMEPADGGSLSCEGLNCIQQLATIKKDVTFSLEVANIFGCKQTDTISYKATCLLAKQFFVPTAFTPNGDGINDVFTALGQGFTLNYFRIYNRWGNLVFESKGCPPNDRQCGWDGTTLQGGKAPSGVYACIVEATCTAGGIFSYRGEVTLIR